MKFIKEVIPYIIILIVVVLVRTYLITPITVVGSSMDPTLHDKQMLLLSKISYKLHDIERFDIVVIKKENEEIIKRVIGLPGEYISYKDNKLYVNGEYIEESYNYGNTKDFDLDYICYIEKYKYYEKNNSFKCEYDKIPDNYYLVLGDNRGISKDSRSIGLIKKDDILGKALIRFWPINKIGSIY